MSTHKIAPPRPLGATRRRRTSPGAADARPARHYDPWTPQEDARLIELRALGYSAADAAQVLRRRTPTVRRRAWLLAARVTDSSRTLGVVELAQALGKKRATIRDWCARGLLPARDAGYRSRHIWRVLRADLIAFLRDVRSFAWVAPAAIIDPALRQIAAEAQRGYLTRADVARRFCVCYDTVRTWDLPWAHDRLHESQLVGFVPPSARPLTAAQAARKLREAQQ